MRNIKHYYELVDRYVYHQEPEKTPEELKQEFSASHCVFPTPDVYKTAAFYHDKLGFQRVDYMDSQDKHVSLCRGSVELILTPSNGQNVVPNHELYGSGADAYIVVKDPQALHDEYAAREVTFIRELHKTDSGKKEFVIEDIDGRWICFQ